MADSKVQIGQTNDFLEGTSVDTPAGTGLFREGVVISDPDVAAARARITNTAPAADAYGLAVRVVGGVVVGSEVEIKNDAGNPIPVSGSVSVSNFPATQQVSGTVALDSASLNALETISVANFPATQAVSDGGGSLTVDGTVSVNNHPASQSVVGAGAAATAQRVQLADESLAALESITATVSGTVNVGNTVAVSATDLDIRNLSSAQDSVTVTGSVTSTVSGTVEITNDVGNPIPVSGTVAVTDGGGSLTVDGNVSVSGTVALDSATLNALESITVQNGAGAAAVNIQDGGNSITVDGSVAVNNFPATQAVNGTVTVTQTTAANLNATVTGTVQANNLVGGTAVSSANPLPISDAGGSLTVDGTVAATQSGSWSVAVNNFPATQAVSGTVTANAGTGTFNVAGSVSVNNTVAVSATDLDIRNLSSAQDSVTVTGSVNVGNFPAVQPVSDNGASLTVDNPTLSVVGAGAAATAQRVQLADESLAALESITATVSGTVNVGNFPATQAVSGTVTANLGTLNGAATAANQTTTNTTLASLDNKTPDESGTWGYNAGVSGTLTVAANKRIIAITATAGLLAASMTINGGQTITIPANGSLTITPRANLVAPTIVFTGTSAYFVEFVE